MPDVDAHGTCHLVGCPEKGKHAPHGIGAGTWADYQKPDTLTEPKVHVLVSDLVQIVDLYEPYCLPDDHPMFDRFKFLLAQHRNSGAPRG